MHLFGVFGVEIGSDFVAQQYGCFSQKCLCYCYALPFAAAQIAGNFVFFVGNAEFFEHGDAFVAIVGKIAQSLVYGIVFHKTRRLRNVGKNSSSFFVFFSFTQSGEIFPVEKYFSRGYIFEKTYTFQQCRFTAAAFACNSHKTLVGKLKTNILKHLEIVAFAKITEF